ncbi:hypothetical protein MSAN_00962000 [Mycena sanguinolenta]|uniref:Uncharacterized protein n=1 Tax=Mycena sanguinolenta TaxID=230812 RepID=A0A8H6YV94_9AGAR|nr:hypothetical protein MSAN_00962000 [Mycena sanguinolenta]
MAQLFFTFLFPLFILQSLAAPVARQAEQSFALGNCTFTSDNTVPLILGIEHAQESLGPLNAVSDITNGRHLLCAQIHIFDANNFTTQIVARLELGPSEHAPPDNTPQLLVNSLQEALSQIKAVNTFGLDNGTLAAVQSANTSIAGVLDSVGLGNCTTTAVTA